VSDLHFHRCGCGMPARCYGRDCVEAECSQCRTGKWSSYLWGYLPHDCCLLNARPLRKDELSTYRLAPPWAGWWTCPTCHRCFGLEPATMGFCVDDYPAP
jgi:hypothetical protein